MTSLLLEAPSYFRVKVHANDERGWGYFDFLDFRLDPRGFWLVREGDGSSWDSRAEDWVDLSYWLASPRGVWADLRREWNGGRDAA